MTHPTAPNRRLAGLAALLSACALALAPPAIAQTSAAPAPPAAASVPATPKLMSPGALRDSATAPGALRPERPVQPQVQVPLQAPPPQPASAPAGAIPPNPAASAGGVSDAVARCEAKTSAVERAKCRKDLAQQAANGRR